MRRGIPLSLALFALAACGADAPRELDGLWSRSEGACAMGAGVRFEADAVRVFLGRDVKVLFDAPQYQVERRGRATRITIDYASPDYASPDNASPTRPGDARPPPGRGTLILERGPDDWIHPVTHAFADKTTGAVHLRLGEEDVTRFFTLRRCSGAPADRT